MKKLPLFVLGILLLMSPAKTVSASEDMEPPVITVTSEEIVLIEGEELDIREYVEVEDENDFHLMSFSKNDCLELGEHQIKLLAIDECGNTSLASISLTVITEEENERRQRAKTLDGLSTYSYPSPSAMNSYILDVNGEDIDADAWAVACSLLGTPGQCSYIAQLFVNSYFGSGHSINNGYVVSAEEAKAGDILYYNNGGLGLPHYAVYLGGNTALQGNYLGTTVIGKVYLNNATAPVFYRLY